MRIIVAGSRDITDYAVVREAFIQSGFWKQFHGDIEVVSGTARGVDRLGEEFARKNGLTCHKFPADWDIHGKAGGHIRNCYMGDFAKEGDGRLLAIWDGVSRGTKQMIDYARSIGLKGYVYRTDKPARFAKVGMRVRTDFSGKVTTHTIAEISKAGISQSGVQFLVEPIVPKSGGDWLDADWFKLYEYT